VKITAQDFYSLYAPSECGLRVYLRAKKEPEAEPSEFEQVLQRLGQRHQAAHLASFPLATDLRALSFEERAQATVAHVRDGTAVLYQPVLKCSATVDGVACECIGEPNFLIREDTGYVVRDAKIVRHVDDEHHPEVVL
jgi:predicted RecB family nuclease